MKRKTMRKLKLKSKTRKYKGKNRRLQGGVLGLEKCFGASCGKANVSMEPSLNTSMENVRNYSMWWGWRRKQNDEYTNRVIEYLENQVDYPGMVDFNKMNRDLMRVRNMPSEMIPDPGFLSPNLIFQNSKEAIKMYYIHLNDGGTTYIYSQSPFNYDNMM